jgi:hypothetical protein
MWKFNDRPEEARLIEAIVYAHGQSDRILAPFMSRYGGASSDISQSFTKTNANSEHGFTRA